MIGTFRADFYRLFRSLGFWLTQLFIIGFIFSTIASQSVGRIVSVGNDTMDEVQAQTQYDLVQWTGVVSVNAVTFMMNAFFFAMLPLLVIIIGHDFSKKTYKNILTVGVSRTTYFLSQYATFALMVLLQIFYVYVVSFLTGTLFYGVGNNFNRQQLIDWLFTASVQFLMIMGILTVCCFITYLTKNNVLPILTAVILPLVISIMVIVLPRVKWLSLLDFEGVLGNQAFILNNSKELHQTILTAVITIFIFIGLTLFQFNRSEL